MLRRHHRERRAQRRSPIQLRRKRPARAVVRDRLDLHVYIRFQIFPTRNIPPALTARDDSTVDAQRTAGVRFQREQVRAGDVRAQASSKARQRVRIDGLPARQRQARDIDRRNVGRVRGRRAAPGRGG